MTRTVPIVFVTVIDPVGAGFVESLAHPGGNTTGFTLFEYGLSGKWVELLKEVVPPVKRVGILRDSAIGSRTGQLAAIQAVAPSFGIELSPIGVREAGDSCAAREGPTGYRSSDLSRPTARARPRCPWPGSAL